MIEDYVLWRTHIRWAKLKKSWKAALVVGSTVKKFSILRDIFKYTADK